MCERTIKADVSYIIIVGNDIDYDIDTSELAQDMEHLALEIES